MIAETVTYDNQHYGKITIPVNDNTIRPCVERGYLWEDYNVELFKKYITPGSVAIDCGAFVGMHSLKMSEYCKRVLAVELMPLHFQCLLDNIYQNDRGNIVPLNCCLTANGYGYDWLPGVDYHQKNNLGGTSLLMTRTSHQVEARSLDQIGKAFTDPVSFIKIDVEGNEEHTLNGARQLIAKHKPTILVEIWKHLLPAFKQTSIWTYLQEQGYTLSHHVNDDYLLTVNKDV